MNSVPASTPAALQPADPSNVSTRTDGLEPLALLCFEGAFNLPVWIAQQRGFFEEQGVTVSMSYTKGSVDMINRLQEGTAQLALTSIDNVFAYTRGQGETRDGRMSDLMAFMGGDAGFLSLVARPGLASVDALRGRTLSVDAMSTGFAFVLRDMLAHHAVAQDEVTFVAAGGTGNRYRELIAGRHDATLVRSPFDTLAQQQGFVALRRSRDHYPAYLGTVGAVRQTWADAHPDALQGFLLGYRRALNWIFDTANAAACAEVLRSEFAGLDPAAAQAVYRELIDPAHGLIRDMDIPEAAARQVLRLRDHYTSHPPGDDALPPCIDLRYVQRARQHAAWQDVR
ncbi:hypothetical protein CI15_15420 [Paraburkholderia monticola]|uniref:SsuA/THI5-like domain-containing protein n=1 Tax=Paraburkholderia monticola TaxID=1399968 RepID=A0A149PR83_9BURK|nr:ABC transporter substrate-binding protein [Paraburkholderia monticola]KXU87528.1 hypothetical protein CI15_15420 [Paraburkholderia monticola]